MIQTAKRKAYGSSLRFFYEKREQYQDFYQFVLTVNLLYPL